VLDAAGERVTLITGSGRVLDGTTCLHTMVALFAAARPGSTLAVPAHASRVVEKIAARTGCSVVRCGRSTRAMSLAGLKEGVGMVGDASGGFMFPVFLSAFDAVMTLGMTAKMIADTGSALDDVVNGLPPWHLFERVVPCPTHLKGAVMRAVSEASAGRQVEMEEGVRVDVGDAWVLALPDAMDPVVYLYAEADDEETALGLLDEYAGIVSAAATE
jgi:mannose-1-phosphate guanylyltransferase/phosphomannomutase